MHTTLDAMRDPLRQPKRQPPVLTSQLTGSIGDQRGDDISVSKGVRTAFGQPISTSPLHDGLCPPSDDASKRSQGCNETHVAALQIHDVDAVTMNDVVGPEEAARRPHLQAPLLNSHPLAGGRMRAEDWSYVGEGGKHALFAHHPNAAVPKDREGLLLRIDKKYLALSASQAEASKQATQEDAAEDPIPYMREMVARRLAPYADLPDKVSLGWDFVRDLRNQAMSGGLIPQRRRRDWLASGDTSPRRASPAVGLLLRDYRFAASESPDGDQKCFCLEIKPKAGYRAFSALVDPGRRDKYKYSKYRLLQKACSAGAIARGWMTVSGQTDQSLYEPLDLFSGDRTRIRRSFSRLMEQPQNNLKIWLGERLLLGLPQAQDAASSLAGLVDLVPVSTSVQATEKEISSALVELATAVVTQEEEFLNKLLQLQKLDILDEDGAIIIYERLVSLCGGSHDTAQRLLDSMPQTAGPGNQPHALLAASPIRAPRESTNLCSLCDVIEGFSKTLAASLPTLPDELQMQAARQQALQIVDSLSIEECQFLLQNWLLSVAMCDISFFVTFQPTTSEDSVDPAGDGPLIEFGRYRFRYCRPQSQQAPGVIALCSDHSTGAHDAVFCYELKIIDYEKKTSTKLRARALNR